MLKQIGIIVLVGLIASAATAAAVLQFWPDGGEAQQSTPASVSAPSAASSGSAALNSACLSAADIYQEL